VDRRLVEFARVPRFAIFTTLALRLLVGVDCGFAGEIEQDQSALGFESPRDGRLLLPEIPSDRLLIAAELSIGSPRSAEFSKGDGTACAA
jgi:hypothetical protein